VFLEHITWFLLGAGAVEQFANARLTTDTKFGFESDIFFTVSSHLKSATLKKEVGQWIERLRQNANCCEYLHSMLELIKTGMLESDPNNRMSTSSLLVQLTKLERFFNRSTSFYTLHWTKRSLDSSIMATQTGVRQRIADGVQSAVRWLFAPQAGKCLVSLMRHPELNARGLTTYEEISPTTPTTLTRISPNHSPFTSTRTPSLQFLGVDAPAGTQQPVHILAVQCA